MAFLPHLPFTSFLFTSHSLLHHFFLLFWLFFLCLKRGWGLWIKCFYYNWERERERERGYSLKTGKSRMQSDTTTTTTTTITSFQACSVASMSRADSPCFQADAKKVVEGSRKAQWRLMNTLLVEWVSRARSTSTQVRLPLLLLGTKLNYYYFFTLFVIVPMWKYYNIYQ